MRPALSLLAAALGTLWMAGCAGPGNEPKTAAAGDYEWVTPLGSSIPVRVPKGQGATSATSPTATMSGEQAASAVSSGGGGSVTKTGSR